MKPHLLQTVRLFNRLFYARPFFWSGLPIRITITGKSVNIEKSGRLSDTIIPLVLPIICITRLGLATLLILRNLDAMPFGLGTLIVIGFQWMLAMHMIYLFLVVMTILGFADIVIYAAALAFPYADQLGKGKLSIVFGLVYYALHALCQIYCDLI